MGVQFIELDDQMNYIESVNECKNQGMELVTLRNPEKQTKLNEWLLQQNGGGYR